MEGAIVTVPIKVTAALPRTTAPIITAVNRNAASVEHWHSCCFDSVSAVSIFFSEGMIGSGTAGGYGMGDGLLHLSSTTVIILL